MREIFASRVLSLCKGKSIAECARQWGIKQAALDRYVKMQRTPTGEAIVDICKATGASADWLLGLSTDQPKAVHATNSAVAMNNSTANNGGGDAAKKIDQLIENLSKGEIKKTIRLEAENRALKDRISELECPRFMHGRECFRNAITSLLSTSPAQLYSAFICITGLKGGRSIPHELEAEYNNLMDGFGKKNTEQVLNKMKEEDRKSLTDRIWEMFTALISDMY